MIPYLSCHLPASDPKRSHRVRMIVEIWVAQRADCVMIRTQGFDEPWYHARRTMAIILHQFETFDIPLPWKGNQSKVA